MTDMERFIAAADALAEVTKDFVPQLCEGVEDGCGKLSRHDCASCEGYNALTEYRAAREAITKGTPPAYATSA